VFICPVPGGDQGVPSAGWRVSGRCEGKRGAVTQVSCIVHATHGAFRPVDRGPGRASVHCPLRAGVACARGA